MYLKFVTPLLVSLSLVACNNKQSETKEPAQDIRETLKKNDLLSFVPFKKLPVTDTTNFDNFNGDDTLSARLVQKLHLKDIEENHEFFFARYRLAFSDGIDAVVITSMAEAEMKTFLVTYRKEDYSLIDKVLIAYDEIVESAFSATGKVSDEQVTVTNYNYMEDEPVIEVKKYRVEKNGKFTPI